MAGTYDGVRRKLIKAFKFDRMRAAHEPLARAMTNIIPYEENIVVVPVPTAAARVRLRGYDQSKLLAREIARLRGWHYADVLRRRHGQRQVGATRINRTRQADSAYELVRSDIVKGRHILIIDDVTTSGATLKAAAKQIAALALQVDAAVVAKHTFHDH